MQLLVRAGSRAGWAAAAVLALACASIAPADARLVHHHHKPKPSPQDIRFAAFVKDFRVTALAAGITPATYDAAMTGLRHNPKIEGLTESQPEFVKPIWSYLDTADSPARVAAGQKALAAQYTILTTLEARSGVPKEIAHLETEDPSVRHPNGSERSRRRERRRG